MGWFACIISAAHLIPVAGVAVVAIAVGYHLISAVRPGAELALLIAAALIGVTWESLLAASGWLVYSSGLLIEGAAPYWMVALWALLMPLLMTLSNLWDGHQPTHPTKPILLASFNQS